ncbi:MAG: UDP-N-acetylmuramate dehydrogenase [Alloprevotella sp.]|nr:UDP-N-acetylmuramate dehydrogenase [Alloprevotella sp.]
MRIFRDHSLLGHNTFGIDAKAACFVEYDNEDELKQLLADYMDNRYPLPLIHIGEGSNFLFSGNFNGTVAHSCIRGVEEVERDDHSVLLRVGAAENWDSLVATTIDRGFYGLENLSLIPGEVGAAAVQNIGAYGAEAEQFIEAVEGITIHGKATTYTHDECQYAYRSSVFKHDLKDRFYVTHVLLRLSLQFMPNLSYGALQRLLEENGLDATSVSVADIRRLIVNFRKEKLPQPSEVGSAGSFFVNPVVSEQVFAKLQADYPDMPHFKAPNGVKIPAGWLIEQTGWRGKNLGRAGVWAKQALVLVNLGGATGEEIVTLSQTIQKDVYEKFGIMLNPEANIV